MWTDTEYFWAMIALSACLVGEEVGDHADSIADHVDFIVDLTMDQELCHKQHKTVTCNHMNDLVPPSPCLFQTFFNLVINFNKESFFMKCTSLFPTAREGP